MVSPFFLAPMAGYTDWIYRDLCINYGAGLTYTEMVSAEGIARGNKNTAFLLTKGKNEKKFAVQIFAPDADTVSRAIPNLLNYKPDIIDLNCGCPVPKITKIGCGSALLKNPKIIGQIVKELKEQTRLPITVKIRLGWDDDNINYLETAEQVFNNGGNALCLHARTKSQLYMPSANWTELKNLKSHFKDEKIFGSGDIFTARDAVKMLTETEVDGVMIARGAIGNPFIFREANELLKHPDILPQKPDENEIKSTAILHLNGLISIYGEDKGCKEMRKHISHYFKGSKNSNKIRQSCYLANTLKEYVEAIYSDFQEI